MNLQIDEGLIRYTVGISCIQPPDIFPLTPTVNKLCNIECCVNKMRQIIQNIMVSQGLELELNMFGRTTTSGRHPLVKLLVQFFFFNNYSTPPIIFQWELGG